VAQDQQNLQVIVAKPPRSWDLAFVPHKIGNTTDMKTQQGSHVPCGSEIRRSVFRSRRPVGHFIGLARPGEVALEGATNWLKTDGWIWMVKHGESG